MHAKSVRVIMIGDVIGRYGRQFVNCTLPLIRKKFQPDVVIANGENSAGGLGIVKNSADELFAAGIDVITGGNHIWDKREALELLKIEPRIIRPLNFPPLAPGGGSIVMTLSEDIRLAVVNLQGRVFMDPVADNPFTTMDSFLRSCPSKLILVDFHAEATAEKQALGFFLDGRVSAVLGTHTHVPTADAHIMDKGTAYQSDVGITGSLTSVIGMKREPIISRFLDSIPHRFEVEKGNMVLDMTIVDIDASSGKAAAVQSQRIWEDHYEQQLH